MEQSNKKYEICPNCSNRVSSVQDPNIALGASKCSSCGRVFRCSTMLKYVEDLNRKA
jgi:transcription elongation factor Elf1